mmetsp:Transcript_23600/g.29073  ORF Transcript_23600/g.29073 Transcript_23600/m.29073 type:complete len:343 (+) Transcript_23600:81-1109(+)|eukprot:CAMPEP_0204840310 /NCGR_PEP_ID=MMETSP1346-20131115/37218_1 /ASSEMBLY_ACC=CAM_ASM_000771 /TAXON_ID=215587 /ORGANISM="Aplanochytrium stocchinoi, Strain GSBS06" /LENGTH=342 /DNA_ID=CAMNT_0051977607 /DNA_START=12 /DNA_END=1040 /DNA_ORIENTATION=+
MGNVISHAEEAQTEAEQRVALKQAQLNGLRVSVKRRRVEDAQEYNVSKLEELKEYFSGIIEEAKAQLKHYVGGADQDDTVSRDEGKDDEATEEPSEEILASKIDMATKEITRKYTEFETFLDENTEKAIEEVKITMNPNSAGIDGILDTVHGMLSDYDTIETARRQWRDFVLVDDIIHESTGEYAVKSGQGYFPHTQVPALKMLRVLELFGYAILAKTKEDRAKVIKEADKRFEAAWWEGVDPNTKQLKKDFLVLRRDKFAYSLSSYNEKLANIVEMSQGQFATLSRSEEVLTNMYAAIMNLAILCSIPEVEPYQITREEQAKSVKSVKACMNFVKQELNVH